jgi:uncharacterized delta-60 repeat protein
MEGGKQVTDRSSSSPTGSTGLRASRPVAALIAICSLFLLTAVALAKPGDLTTSFDGDGIAQLSSNTRLFGGAVQPDGKLVAVGEQTDAGGSHALVARFTTTGALDRSFSGDGLFLGGAGTTARGVAVQGTNIVVAGSLTGGGGGMLAIRLKANGSADHSFSGDGVATALVGRGGEAHAVAIQGTKIVLAGGGRLADQSDAFARVALARFNPNGSPDGSFGQGGAVVQDFGRLSLANSVAVQGQKIVIGGQQRNNLQTTNLLAARFNNDGTPDGGFGGNAGLPGLFVQQYAKSGGYSAALGVVVDGQGRVVLGGGASNGSADPEGFDALAVRLRSNGTPDPGFSGDGVVYLPATSDKSQFNGVEPFPGAHGVVLSGNNIVLGGYFDARTEKQLAVWALSSAGAPVAGFGTAGRTVTPFQGGAELNGLAAAPNVIYGVGDSSTLFDLPKGIAARYTGFPSPVQLTVKVKHSYKLGSALRRGIPVTFVCDQACTINAVLKALGGTVAKAKGKLSGAGSKTLKLRFTAAGKRKLAGKSRVAAKLIATAKGGGKTDKVTKRLVLKG